MVRSSKSLKHQLQKRPLNLHYCEIKRSLSDSDAGATWMASVLEKDREQEEFLDNLTRIKTRDLCAFNIFTILPFSSQQGKIPPHLEDFPEGI